MAREHGRQSSLALGWLDRNDQLARFKALAGMENMSDCTVLDAGCGYGDLLPFLSELYPGMQYTGIEQIPEFIDEAKRRYGSVEQSSFLSGNFTEMDLPAADFVLASGSLNYRSQAHDFIFKAIARLYAACSHGFGFNLLRHIAPDGLLMAYEPEHILAYCRKLSGDVELIDGYAPEDFTIYMYR